MDLKTFSLLAIAASWLEMKIQNRKPPDIRRSREHTNDIRELVIDTDRAPSVSYANLNKK